MCIPDNFYAISFGRLTFIMWNFRFESGALINLTQVSILKCVYVCNVCFVAAANVDQLPYEVKEV